MIIELAVQRSPQLPLHRKSGSNNIMKHMIHFGRFQILNETTVAEKGHLWKIQNNGYPVQDILCTETKGFKADEYLK